MWLNSVHDGLGKKLGPGFRRGGIEDLQDIKALKSQQQLPTFEEFKELFADPSLHTSLKVAHAAMCDLGAIIVGGEGTHDEEAPVFKVIHPKLSFPFIAQRDGGALA